MTDILRIENLYKSFGNTSVLNDINIEFKRGTVTTIIGPSGSGKSTLLRCINQLETITSGKVFFNEKDITLPDVNLSNVRSKIGMVFQSFNLFENLTVLENCTIGQVKVLKRDKESAKNKALKNLEKVGMLEFVNRSVNKLSGGQKQRVAIARTLSMDPDIILFDEPTSSLDPEMVQEVLEVIKSVISAQLSFIIVTHEMSFAKNVSNRIVFMDEGRIVESGSPKKIFENAQNERLKRFVDNNNF